jgi:RNA polymerase sigma-70 factor, ECF subfamily
MRQHSRMSAELALRFDREMAQYRSSLQARALRMTHNREDAEDLVQETLVRACRAFHRFSGDHAKAWLHRIMTNAFINDYRKRQRDPVVMPMGGPDQLPAGQAAGMAPGQARSAETQVLEQIPTPEVKAALDSLPAEFRRALLLADVHGLSYSETAQTMGTPVGTVMSRLHRARAAVRASLEVPRPASGPAETDSAETDSAAELVVV